MKTGPRQNEVREALLEAFPTAQEFTIVVFDADVGVRFENFLAASNAVYDEALYALLTRVEARNKLVQLIESARKANPGNPKLAAVAAELGVLEAKYKAVVDTTTDQPTFGEAEALIFNGFDFEDAGNWFAAMARHRLAVCRIEPQPQAKSLEGYGTGFLVAPDVVMTNDHVAKWFYEDDALKKANDVVLRFDFEVGPDGVAVSSGTPHKLHKEWRVARSLETDLDFALLKLEKPAGADLVGDSPRGFLTPNPYTFTPPEGLVILQHPMAAPLKFALGPVDANSSWPPNRVSYKVNTQPGSSGSPCFTQQRKVAAIHHCGETSRNSGVLMTPILDHLKKLVGEERKRLTDAGLAHLLA